MSMMISPYRFVTAGGGDVMAEVHSFETQSGPTFNATTAALNGLTPKAALLFGGGHITANDPAASTEMAFAVGATDGTSSGFLATSSQWGTANTNTFRHQGGGLAASVPCFNVRNESTSRARMFNDGFIAGGISFSESGSVSNGERKVGAVFFAGASVEAYCGETGSLGTSAATTVISSLPFQPDLVIFFGSQGANDATGETFMGMLFGAATGDGTQKCVAWAEADGVAAGQPFQIIRSNRALSQVDASTGVVTYTGIVGSFTSSGFSITTDASANNDGYQFLALNLNGYSAKVIDFATPTATGSQAYTGVGFTPQAAICVMTALESRDAAGSNSDLSGSLMISAFTAEAEVASVGRIDSGAGTTDTASNTKNQALLGGSATSTTAIQATLTSFDPDGLTLNYSAVAGTAKMGFMICIEAA